MEHNLYERIKKLEAQLRHSQKMEAVGTLAGVKILFMSGYTMNIINGKELAKTGSDFIKKPFTPKDLLIKMREVLDR